MKLDAPVNHHTRAEFIQTARERKEYEGEEGDLRAVDPHVLANVIKNKLLEMDHIVMKDKKEKYKAYEENTESEEAKALL